jgi:FtsP/CotA-like multicopper oxidase with cupredoxin domain
LFTTFLLDTPLAIAALEGDHDLFRLLLERGALPALRESQHGVTGVVQDAHNVPRLVAHECSASVGVKLRLLRTFHQFGGSLLQPLRSGDTVYVKYSNRLAEKNTTLKTHD